jgi:regulator of sigma E protease
LTERSQEVAFRFGLIVVLSLMVFATWNDLVQLNVIEFFKGLVS